jgi:hypothetical protein
MLQAKIMCSIFGDILPTEVTNKADFRVLSSAVRQKRCCWLALDGEVKAHF